MREILLDLIEEEHNLDIPTHTGGPAPEIFDDPMITEVPEVVGRSVVTMGEAPEGFIGDWSTLTPDERSFVERETAVGRSVEAIPTGPDRTPDFLIDGVRTELKTIRPRNSDPDQVSASIARAALDGRSQSGHIVIDASYIDGLALETAERGINRAFGRDQDLQRFQSLRVIGPDFDITVEADY